MSNDHLDRAPGNPEQRSARILRERARVLGRSRAPEAAPGSLLDVLQFNLSSERYAVESRFVREVQPLQNLTPLPGTPDFVLGIVNIRGRILPVYDLRKFFDLPERGLTDLHRVIVVGAADLELGLLADISLGVASVARDSLQAGLPTLTGIRADYLKGITAERLVVLDLARFLADPNIIVHDDH